LEWLLAGKLGNRSRSRLFVSCGKACERCIHAIGDFSTIEEYLRTNHEIRAYSCVIDGASFVFLGALHDTGSEPLLMIRMERVPPGMLYEGDPFRSRPFGMFCQGGDTGSREML